MPEYSESPSIPPSYGITPISGQYLGNYSSTTAAPATGTVRVLPVYIPRTVTINALRGEVTITGGAGSLVDLAIYSALPINGQPNTLLASVTIDGTIVSEQEVAITPLVLPPGTYWFGGLSRVGAATIRVGSNTTLGMPSLQNATMSVNNYSLSTVAAVLPTIFGPASLSTVIAPLVRAKVA